MHNLKPYLSSDGQFMVMPFNSFSAMKELPEHFYNLYFNTDQDASVYAMEFHFLFGEIILNNRIPVKLRYLSDYKESLKNIFQLYINEIEKFIQD